MIDLKLKKKEIVWAAIPVQTYAPDCISMTDDEEVWYPMLTTISV